MEPTFKINGTKFIYTLEQNSWVTWLRKNPIPDTICMGVFRTSSIDSIIDIVKGLKGKDVSKNFACSLGGWIDYMAIADGTDTIKYNFDNTFDRTLLKVVQIIFEYLSPNIQTEIGPQEPSSAF